MTIKTEYFIECSCGFKAGPIEHSRQAALDKAFEHKMNPGPGSWGGEHEIKLRFEEVE